MLVAVSHNITAKRSQPLAMSIKSPGYSSERSSSRSSLQDELLLDRGDLRSHGWYHGNISRERCEQLLVSVGSFLVRDCTSKKNHYVLSCRSHRRSSLSSLSSSSSLSSTSPPSSSSSVLHFMINRLVLKPNSMYERVQYMLEDETFDSIPDLVTFYVGNKRPISKISGAIISNPVNRLQAIGPNIQTSSINGSSKKKVVNSKSTSRSTHGRITPILDMLVKPLVPNDSYDVPVNFRRSVAESRSSRCESRSSLASTRISFASGSNDSLPTLPLGRNLVDKENDEHYLIPKKPIPVEAYIQEKALREKQSRVSSASSTKEDLENDYCYIPEVEQPASNVINTSSPIIRPMETLSIDDLYSKSTKVPSTKIGDQPRVSKLSFDHPSIKSLSCIDPEDFFSDILPANNKPLESSTMSQVHNLLLKSGTRFLANHLTAVDLEFIGHFKNGCKNEHLESDHDSEQPKNKTSSTLKLLMLPEGYHYRLDLLDKRDSLKYFVAVTILLKAADGERAALISKWIQIASEVKSFHGNLNGFTGIILGLMMPQIKRLEKTWSIVRQIHTESAVIFETRLRPFLGKLIGGKVIQAPNTSFPYVLTLIEILHKYHEMVEAAASDGCSNQQKDEILLSKISTANAKVKDEFWEKVFNTEYGVEPIARHLSSGHEVMASINLYKSNGSSVLSDVSLEDIVLDIFRTEFHRRILWGSRGCDLDYEERCNKMDQVLMVLSEKWEEL